MTEQEHCLQDAREWASRRYRAEGFDNFAEQVERGAFDECSQMRLARFFIEPTPPHTDAYFEAWKRAAAAAA